MNTRHLFFLIFLPLLFGMSLNSVPEESLFRVKPYLQLYGQGNIQITWFSDQNLPSEILVKNAEGSVVWESGVTGEFIPEIYYTAQEKAQMISDLPQGSWLFAEQTHRYRVALVDLPAGQSYSYEVTLGSEKFSASFKTKPDQDWESLRFIAFSDSETEPRGRDRHRPWAPGTPLLRPFGLTVPSLWKEKFGFTTQSGIEIPHYLLSETQGYAENLNIIKSRKPDFILMPGDLVQGGGYQPAWDEFFRHNAGEFDQVLTSLPLIPALGNWENYGGISGGYRYNDRGEFAPKVGRMRFHAYFETPEEDPLKKHRQSYYRVDYGPVTILTLDSSNGTPDQLASDFSDEEKVSGKELTELGTDTQENYTAAEYASNGGTDLSGFHPGSDQYRWLESNLKAASEAGQLIFVQYHHIAYSSGEHGVPLNHELSVGQTGLPMRVLHPLLEEYGVIAVLSGHDELFERSVVDENGDGKGVLYYDVGVAGDGIFGVKRDYSAIPFPKVDYNPFKVWTADENSEEIWNSAGANPVITDGGKHYGHLEVNVSKVKDGAKTFAKVDFTPVYVFPQMNEAYELQSVERRVYPDEVSVLVELTGAETTLEPLFKSSIRVELNENGMAETSLQDYLENEVQSDWEVIFSRSETYTCADLSGTENELKITDSKGNTWTKVVLVEVLDTLPPDFEATNANLPFDQTIGKATLSPDDFYIRTEFIYENCLATAPVRIDLSKTEITCSDLNPDGTYEPITVEITLTDQSGNSTTKKRMVELNVFESKKVSLSALNELYEGGEVELRLGEELEYEVLSWYRNDQLIEGEKGNSILVQQQGLYYAEIQLSNGCQVKSERLNVEQSSFDFPELKAEILLELGSNGKVDLAPESVFLRWPLEDPNWTVSLSQQQFDCSDLGEKTIEVTLTDESGAIWTRNLGLRIADKLAPNLVVNNLEVHFDVSIGKVELTEELLIEEFSDNCGELEFGLSQTELTCADIGKKVDIRVVAEDFSGNRTEKTAVVTVTRFESDPIQIQGESLICEGDEARLEVSSEKDFEVVEWRRNGQKISGQHTKVLETKEPGVYQALIRYAGACLSESNDFEVELAQFPEGAIIQDGSKLVAPEGVKGYQWYRNGELLEGENERMLELNQMGSYEVELENEVGCKKRLSAIEVSISGLISRLDVMELTLYPNPANHQIKVKLPRDLGLKIAYFDVFEMNGKRVTESLFTRAMGDAVLEIEVETLSSGVYLIWVLDEKGTAYLGRFSKVE
ncbi:T9SS type A sorting domain-containing protein [Algoriphagus sp.]|uniref:T9SS type A sorting domain-containing protein n=1 Tax=Algoriphagus sp. TaxID=1872435 RepID=UPI00261739E7|nr:T9SS type A sorting domain-containing protein [Algoriphagus sp.]